MAQFIRVRRIKRKPMRLGTTTITNTSAGTLINLDDAATLRDLRNFDWNNIEIIGTSADGRDAALGIANIPFGLADADVAATTNGNVRFTPIGLKAGDLVSNITVFSGNTAQTGSSPHSWACLATNDGTKMTLLAVSADNTALLAAKTLRAFAMGTAYLVPTSGTYYAGVLFGQGTQAPTLVGHTVNSANGVGAAWFSALSLVNGACSTAETTPLAVGDVSQLNANITNDAIVPWVKVS